MTTPTTLKPGQVSRLLFVVSTSAYAAKTDLTHSGISNAAYITVTDGKHSGSSAVSVSSTVAPTADPISGQLVTVDAAKGVYGIDCPAGAALVTADYSKLVLTLSDGTLIVDVVLHPISNERADLTSVKASVEELAGGVGTEAV